MELSLWSASALSFFLVAALTPAFIRVLRVYKLTQPIRAELPPDHQAKQGTPLMAGAILLTAVVISACFHPSPLVVFIGITFVLFGWIGFMDDYKKAVFQDPSGMSGKMKLLLQFAVATVLLMGLIFPFDLSPDIALAQGVVLHLPIAVYVVLMLLVIVGSANAINFTDGLDGLLIHAAIPSYLFFFVISENMAVQTFSLVMIGGLLGLLLYNIYPAKAFMGDTGSLAIGGSLSFLAVIEKVELLIPILFFVYMAEQLSVILQVWYYRKTRLRLFRMAPIHFHFGLKYGWSEHTIVIVFGSISWLAALVSWLIWTYLL